jgi:hypothetical protein
VSTMRCVSVGMARGLRVRGLGWVGMGWIGEGIVAVLIVVSVGVSVKQSLWGKRKTADPVGCGSVTGFSWVESEKRATPPGRWGIPVAIGKSAGRGASVHRD